MLQPQQHQIWATSVIYATAYSNARFLTQRLNLHPHRDNIGSLICWATMGTPHFWFSNLNILYFFLVQSSQRFNTVNFLRETVFLFFVSFTPTLFFIISLFLLALGLICSSFSRFSRSQFFFFFFGLKATPTTYGCSQARGGIRTVDAGLCYSHSNTRSEPHLWPTPQHMATLDL